MSLAPIVLFVYNRPAHTLQTLEALSKNAKANESELFIFCDGAKALATTEERNAIQEVRKIARSRQWCKKVHIVERHENWGLANSIMAGVTQIVEKFGKVIVLEDDILTAQSFLSFMNQALEKYENEPTVMHISGYLPPVRTPLPSTFFLRLATCWGWATWKRAWQKFNPNPHEHLDFLRKNHLLKQFDLDGANPFSWQLQANAEGTIYTWAIKWYASIFRENGLSLHPYPSLTQNIGNDGSGQSTDARATHFAWSSLGENIALADIPLEESLQAKNAVIEFYQRLNQSGTYLKSPFLKKLKQYFPTSLEQRLKFLLIPSYRRTEKQRETYQHWKERLQTLPRYKPHFVALLGQNLLVDDGVSFLAEYEFVFEKEKLKFYAAHDQPLIFLSQDHLGLRTLFFKTLYPKSTVYLHASCQTDYLLTNLARYGLSNVHFIDFNQTVIPPHIDLVALEKSFLPSNFLAWISAATNIFYETSSSEDQSQMIKKLVEHGFSVEVENYQKVFSSLWTCPWTTYLLAGYLWGRK